MVCKHLLYNTYTSNVDISYSISVPITVKPLKPRFIVQLEGANGEKGVYSNRQ